MPMYRIKNSNLNCKKGQKLQNMAKIARKKDDLNPELNGLQLESRRYKSWHQVKICYFEK